MLGADGGLRLPERSPEEPVASEPAALDVAAPADMQKETATGAETAAGAVDEPETGSTVVAAPAAAARSEAEPGVSVGTESTAAADAVESEAAGAPVVDGTRKIVLTFSAASWVDVRDSERKFKLFGEIPKGSRRVLGGQPPYKLVIGNAGAVKITVNGKPFDISRYAKGNVARFTLDP